MMTIYSTDCLNTLIRGRQSLIPVSIIDKKAVKKGQARMDYEDKVFQESIDNMENPFDADGL